jgi:hypothetical protein
MNYASVIVSAEEIVASISLTAARRTTTTNPGLRATN